LNCSWATVVGTKLARTKVSIWQVTITIKLVNDASGSRTSLCLCLELALE
jgi:hypothetical protein